MNISSLLEYIGRMLISYKQYNVSKNFRRKYKGFCNKILNINIATLRIS